MGCTSSYSRFFCENWAHLDVYKYLKEVQRVFILLKVSSILHRCTILNEQRSKHVYQGDLGYPGLQAQKGEYGSFGPRGKQECKSVQKRYFVLYL